MLAEKAVLAGGCTDCQYQLILQALPMWHGSNLFYSLLSAWKTYSSKAVVADMSNTIEGDIDFFWSIDIESVISK